MIFIIKHIDIASLYPLGYCEIKANITQFYLNIIIQTTALYTWRPLQSITMSPRYSSFDCLKTPINAVTLNKIAVFILMDALSEHKYISSYNIINPGV